jgi:hypothetical protein
MTEPPTRTSTASAQERIEERLREREQAQAAAAHLAKLHGAQELRAAVLGLLVPRGSRRALTVWRDETHAWPDAQGVLTHLQALPAASRLPWLETLVLRLRQQPLADRQSTLEATRRLMGARGSVRPLDRLHWLAMRQWLGGAATPAHRASATSDLSRLPASDISAIGRYSAFLSRMVPLDQAKAARHDDGSAARLAREWYDAAMSLWKAHAAVAACEPPDIDALVQALHELQALAWMHRPMIVRNWVIACLPLSPSQRLQDLAADALRLSCVLLDSPMPPELARHFADPAPG